VYGGDLERYVELACLVAELPGPARAFGLPAYVDGLQASGRADEAVQLTTASVAAAREVGSPFWIVYALWTAGLAHGHSDPTRALAAWDEGMEVVREHRVDFFEGFIARDAARLHAANGDPEAALPRLRTALDVFVRAGNIAQLIITVASVPLVLEQLGRATDAATLLAALDAVPASHHHVPELAALASRLDAVLGASELEQCRAQGAQFDLARVAAFARERLDELQAETERRRSGQPPGGLTRRELDVVRLMAQGYPTRAIAERLFISAKTADHHIQHIYTKLGVSNRVATARWAVEQGIVVGGIE